MYSLRVPGIRVNSNVTESKNLQTAPVHTAKSGDSPGFAKVVGLQPGPPLQSSRKKRIHITVSMGVAAESPFGSKQVTPI
jgi:hypothetical protein